MLTRRPILQLVFSVIACLSSGFPAKASSLDSLLNLPVMGVPVINYTPETDWSFGGALQAYFRVPGQSRTSIVQVDGAYTLNKQWYVNASGNIYFAGRVPWLLQVRGGYRDYPDVVFQRGNVLEKTPVGCLSQRGYANVQALFSVGREWSIGPLADFLSENNSVYGSTLMLGFGAVVQYDTRDVIYYPSSGFFFKTSLAYYDPYLGSSSRLGALSVDMRQFVPVWRFVFAWQFRSSWAFSGSDDVPYQMLASLGGQDLVRGVRTNMYRDNALMALQAEWRIPIWNIIHACVFAGVGDVYNMHDWNWAVPKVGYGLGLRLGINKAKVNIRFDVARNNIDKDWSQLDSYSFYLTATEAF